MMKECLLVFLQEQPKRLSEIYDAFPSKKKHSIRARLNENVGSLFERVEPGVYIATKFDYSVVVADPPWSYNNKSSRGGADNHYSTMVLSEIKALPVSQVCQKNAVLFMWATFPLLKEALEVIESWGFRYVTCGFTWVKTNKNGTVFKGTGNYTRANAEVCLIGVKGKGIPRINRSISQVVISQRGKHSAKPSQTLARIESLYGDQKRIELFARNRRDGWDAWGDQVE